MPFEPQWVELIPSAPSAAVPELAEQLEAARDLFERRGEAPLVDSFVWSVLIGRDLDAWRDVESRIPSVHHVMFGFFEPALDDRDAGPALIVEVDVNRTGIGTRTPVSVPRLDSITVLTGTSDEQRFRRSFAMCAMS